MEEKLPLYKENHKKPNYGKVIGWGLVASVVGMTIFGHHTTNYLDMASFEDFCPTLQKVVPSYDETLSNLDYFKSYEYRNKSLKAWGDAVRIPTSNFDDLGDIDADPRWDIFYNFSNYLIETFPNVYEASDLTKVNTHGLVFTINGTDETLQPLMLCGHQDVVPVPEDGVSRWTYPPFEGVFDGEYLWGRGSSDCKNNVIAIFEALEELLTKNFKPKRSIIIALGFDEETSGHRGANKISEYLKNKLGDKSVFMIIDEGGLGIQDLYGSRFALPSTGEKGYVDITIELITTGGHSSVPPRHTGIGMIADLIHAIEAEEYPLDVTPKSPFFYQLQCEAKSSKTMSDQLKKDIKKINSDKSSKRRVLDEITKSIDRIPLVSTTQAIDIIYGGLKINALPEKVTVRINHRISYDSSLEKVKEKLLKAIDTISDKFKLDVDAFGEILKEHEVSSGLFKVFSDEPLTPAPLTPTINNPTWDLLGGTIKHVFEDFASYKGESTEDKKEITVSPSCMTGNTDTRYYWDLTENIYRFTPIRQTERFNAHAIDERVSLDAHIEGVVFFYEFIRNLNSL